MPKPKTSRDEAAATVGAKHHWKPTEKKYLRKSEEDAVPVIAAQGKDGRGLCWCGKEMNWGNPEDITHDWPGKAEGKPHPREETE